MTYNVLDVAKWFLYRNQLDVDSLGADLISNLKLQKLLYYAQGCSLALKDENLFNENILAWDHGPVVDEVYQEYKSNGSKGIPYKQDYSGNIVDADAAILEQVYDIFGQYSAWGLRNKTHQEKPWIETPKDGVIKSSMIKEYFENNYLAE